MLTTSDPEPGSESAYAPIVDGIAPGALTLVVLMGVAQRARIAARLIARGWSPTTPTALLFGASQPGSFTLRGALGELAALTAEQLAQPSELPAVLVIGEVVSLADVIAHAQPSVSPASSVPIATIAERSL